MPATLYIGSTCFTTASRTWLLLPGTLVKDVLLVSLLLLAPGHRSSLSWSWGSTSACSF